MIAGKENRGNNKGARRKFITSALASLIGLPLFSSNLKGAGKADLQDLQFRSGGNLPSHGLAPAFPKALEKGCKIAITAPASGTTRGEVRRGVNFFENLGCEVEIGKTINGNYQYKYLSAPDEIRAAELMSYIVRDDIAAIHCARGGYGVMRILPLLNYNLIARNPKPIIGFSDITALINAIYKICNIVGFHGPVASSSLNNFTASNLEKALFKSEEYDPVKVTGPPSGSINSGVARGRLVGGNLSLIASTMGAPYEINAAGKILFLEETFTEPYKIDRMLTQLWAAGIFDACAGIAVGNFEALDTRRNFYPGPSYTIREVLVSRLEKTGKPAVLGLPFGHVKNNVTLPVGAMAELDGAKRELTILEKGVV